MSVSELMDRLRKRRRTPIVFNSMSIAYRVNKTTNELPFMII